MNDLKQTIATLRSSFIQALEQVGTLQELEHVRIAFLGRQGQLASIMSCMKNLSLEEKKLCGPLLNELKQTSEQLFNVKKEALEQQNRQQELKKKQFFDVTAYRAEPFKGGLHLYSHIIQELEDIFISMGYQVVDGPEIETSFYNFEALNIPQDHPARDMQDTFWLTLPGYLMRTQTSNVQIRTLEKQRPPVAIISAGRVYRNEATDASHDFMFTQLECLVVDKTISLSNLLGTTQTFLQRVFGNEKLKIRARPGYFPFVEPGIEIDASCLFCTDGCSICKRTTWIELLGAGLVHPNVLRACGVDPQEFSGFAFGMGIERLAMLKHGITDIRLFHGNSLSFLRQF
ncbi:phenylalanine--tRNA ligase subunit alpha [Candidatus Dependentiae bacterium]|nr:phenylalanine--tRNA ligase subunit alpha [Candidatus Dependentiae bacterium]